MRRSLTGPPPRARLSRLVGILVMAGALVITAAVPAGAEFSDRQRLNRSRSMADNPVVVSGGTWTHAFWTEWVIGSGNAVFYARSGNDGRSWESARRITAYSAWTRKPDVVAVGPDIHLVFQSNHATTEPETYYRRSRNSGTNWDPIVRISRDDGRQSVNPTVGAEGSRVMIGWFNAFYFGDAEPAGVATRFSNDSGNRFGRERLAYPGWAHPHLAMLDGTAHMVFGGFSATTYQRSSNGGKTWRASRRLSPTSHLPTAHIDIEAGNGSIHIVFVTQRWDAKTDTMRPTLYYRRLDHPRGWRWARRTQLSGSGEAPMVSAHGGMVAVTYLKYRLVSDTAVQKIYVRTSRNGGQSFARAARVVTYRSSCFTTHAGVTVRDRAVVVWTGGGGCTPDAWAARYR